MRRLLAKYPEAEITALSRRQQKSDDPRVEWKACDLFSLKSLEEATPAEVDLAYYLVHSMGPTAQLDQGSFADYDLILADNFARAVKATGLKQLIYLSGLVPNAEDLSLHLQSRLEVEEVFAEHCIPTTVFRAGLILGKGGSSFQILIKLVKRLPVMLCPKWTQTLTTPVDLATVINSLSEAALGTEHIGRIYDLAGCHSLTYLEMMNQTAKRLGKKRFFFTIPYFTPTLSRLWVSLVTNTPKALVYPLIESLQHPMVARPTHYFSTEWSNRTYQDLLEKASVKTSRGPSIFQFKAQRKTVRSVQRLTLPEKRDARWVRDQYMDWLPRGLSPLIKVRVDGDDISFSAFTSKPVLLKLRLSKERSHRDRQLFYITGGLLVAKGSRGRLEFRVALNRKFVLVAIHNYTPSLPWFVYKFTQALMHLYVMKAFGRYLQGSRH